MSDDLARRVLLRPLHPADVAELERIHRTQEVRRWWGDPAPGFPADDPGATRLTIEVDGAVAGLIQYDEENEPRFRHASVDLFLDPALHRQGLGTEALRQMLVLLVTERGHHRITIDPAVENRAAIRSYEKAGFQTVGVMRQYEREPDSERWRDALSMEFVAPPS